MDRARGAFAAGPAWSAWGAPVFDAQLVRNRHGPVGRWIMEWKCDECLFCEPAAYPQPVAAAPAHRPHQAQLAPSSAARGKIRPSIVVAKQHNALLISRARRRGRALGLAVGLPLANARAICPELTVFDADEVGRPQDTQRHRRLVRPLHAAGGARSAARPVSRHHRLRPSVRRRGRADAAVMRRADAAGFCRQRGDCRHLGLRAHADAPCLRQNRRRWRGGRGGQPAAGVRARRRRCHHRAACAAPG